MPLIIPNATDTTSGNKYVALDQAEPDSLDIEIAGNVGRSGVVSGLAVTSNSSAANVNVAAGVIALNGSAYAVSASPTYALPAAPADNRFDLIVARVSGGTASLVTVSGPNDATNPVFPKSRAVITGTYDPASHIDLDTDVVIAAIYRSGSAVITTSRIMDKRALQSSGIVLQGTSVPNSSVGTGPGNLYFKSDTTDGDGTDSGVYVRLASGDWIGLAKDVGLHVPIGGAILWPSKAAVPANFSEADGGSMSTSTYPTLFSVYGYDHGGSGGTFLKPNYNNKFIRGTTNTANIGQSVGTDTMTLSETQLPPHTHSMGDTTHTHNFAHTHPLDHGHSAVTTSSAGSHQHGPGSLAVVGIGGRNPMLREPTYAATNYATGYYNTGNGVVRIWSYTSGDTGQWYFGGGMAISQLGQLVVSGLVDAAGTHSHTASVASYTGTTTSQSTSTTGPASTPVSGESGGGNSISLIPASKYSRWIIRVS